jgi:hypothetical protein
MYPALGTRFGWSRDERCTSNCGGE